jgi:hypothetical protein
MSIPLEEKWRFEPSEDHSGFVMFPAGGSMLVKFDPGNYTHDVGAAKGKLAAKAPEMAHLLIRLVKANFCKSITDDAKRLLAEAGIEWGD